MQITMPESAVDFDAEPQVRNEYITFVSPQPHPVHDLAENRP
jgi:hypothetical protein